jgi:hypothetical protein
MQVTRGTDFSDANFGFSMGNFIDPVVGWVKDCIADFN